MMLTNQTLTYGIAAYIPFVYPCALEKPVTCDYPGIDYEIFDHILRLLKLRGNPVPLPNSTDWGKLVSPGVYSGAMGMVQKGELDTLNVWYISTPDRIHSLSMTYPIPYSRNKFGFVYRKRDRGLDLEASKLLFTVFDNLVWLFLGCLILLGLLVFLVGNAMALWGNGVQNLSLADLDFSVVWDVIAMLLDKHCKGRMMDTRSGNITMVSLGFLFLSLQAAYSGVLISILTSTEVKPPFNSANELADLVAKDAFKLVYDNGTGNTFFWDRLKADTSPTYRKLNQSLRHNPVVLESNITRILDKLEEDPTLIYPGQDLLYGIQLIRGRCDLTFTADRDHDASMFPFAYMFRKNSSFAEPFSRLLGSLSSMVTLTEDKYLKYELTRNRLECENSLTNTAEPLQFSHYTGLLNVVRIMLIAAGLTLLTEIIMFHASKEIMVIWNERQRKLIGKLRSFRRYSNASKAVVDASFAPLGHVFLGPSALTGTNRLNATVGTNVTSNEDEKGPIPRSGSSFTLC